MICHQMNTHILLHVSTGLFVLVQTFVCGGGGGGGHKYMFLCYRMFPRLFQSEANKTF
jgi:hypothetical protein